MVTMSLFSNMVKFPHLAVDVGLFIGGGGINHDGIIITVWE